MTATLETTRRIPATATAAGQVVTWHVEPGTKVLRGDELGTFLDDYGEVLALGRAVDAVVEPMDQVSQVLGDAFSDEVVVEGAESSADCVHSDALLRIPDVR